MRKYPLSILLIMLIIVILLCFGCGEIITIKTESVILSWLPPATNEDGSELTDLYGYRVYYGLSSQIFTNVVDVGMFHSCTIGNLQPGNTYYFAVTGYDKSGNEGNPSNVISINIVDDDSSV